MALPITSSDLRDALEVMKGKENRIVGMDHVNWLCRRLVHITSEKTPIKANHDYVLTTLQNLSGARAILRILHRGAFIKLEEPKVRADGSVHFTLLPRGADAYSAYEARILIKML